MSIFKCKMCGGTIEFEPGATVGVCDSCGTKQTLPRLDSDRKSNLYDRANHFRRNNDFDKAMGIYEQILNEDNTDAEAYWSLVLCRYGIEYVEDPATHKRIPTVNRAQYTSIYMDEDYKAALQYADVYQRQVYEEEAKTIDDIQKGILEISSKEEPFDVFICYKETDNNGRRTQDSVLANDLYHQLTQEGFKVFFSRITLEDKLGTAYEPYIFAALNSAKVMVVLGTKPEYFNAVWVKNEWSRYLALIKQGKKKMLIPAYRDMDPYDLPEEFSHLQAQDMSKLGFMQDLIRGIKKIIGPDPSQQAVQQTIVTATPAYSSNVDALLKRGNMALEDHEWKKADDFFEEVLNQNAECSAAYLGKWMAAEKQPNLTALFEEFGNRYNKRVAKTFEACPVDEAHIFRMINENQIPNFLDSATIKKQYDFDRSYQSEVESLESQKKALKEGLSSERLYTRAHQYAQGSEKIQLEQKVADLIQLMDDRIEKARHDVENNISRVSNEYKNHLAKGDQMVMELRERAENNREGKYQESISNIKKANTITDFQKVINDLAVMNGYKETADLVGKCNQEIYRLMEKERKEKEEQNEKLRLKELKAKKKKRGIITIICVVAIIGIIFGIIYKPVIVPMMIQNKYEKGIAYYNEGDYDAAYNYLNGLNYKDSNAKLVIIELLRQNTNVGSYIYFGSMEQDNSSYEKEKIEWLVLEKEDNRILVISKNVLTCERYYKENSDITWEQCHLRTWLNDMFLQIAFSNDEQQLIMETNVYALPNMVYLTNPGGNMTDKVFVLSISEAEYYFGSEEARRCSPTRWAVQNKKLSTNNQYQIDGEDVCRWWLRTPGMDSNYASYIDFDGSINYDGQKVDSPYIGLRPAMWIDLGDSARLDDSWENSKWQ